MEQTTKTLRERLAAVQIALKAPKGQRNSFGNYNYRSCEDILEAVKPLLSTESMVLTLSDELVNIGDRYYIRATASVTFGSEDIFVTGLAREEETKKGMDGSQITGTASSYARKYALNGLFLIDDTKDADTDEHHNQTTPKAATALQSAPGATTTQAATKSTGEAQPCSFPGCTNMQEYDLARKCYEKYKRVYCGKHWGMANKGELPDQQEVPPTKSTYEQVQELDAQFAMEVAE